MIYPIISKSSLKNNYYSSFQFYNYFIITMTHILILCSNCGRHHCCNFRPLSPSNTLKDTISTATTIISPFNSTLTTNQHHSQHQTLPQQQLKLTLTPPSPLPSQIVRPKSNSTHYLFKKQPNITPKPIADPLPQQTTSPKRVNFLRQNVSNSKRTTNMANRLEPAISKQVSSPSIVKQVTPSSLVRINYSPQLNKPQLKSINVSYLPKADALVSSSLKASPIIRPERQTMPSAKTVFPRPSNVMSSEAISKISQSKMTTADCHQKNKCFGGLQHSECTYRDNRCLGFDFSWDQANQLRLDNTGHVKGSLQR